MNQPKKTDADRKQYWLNLTLVGAVGQVGCLTLVVILVAVFGGLWLDARFDSRPLFTFIFLIASIPVSLVAMFFIARLATSKIKVGPPPKQQATDEAPRDKEVGIGNDS